MPEYSTTPRPTSLISTAVLVIALAAVFFVGKSLGDDGEPTAAQKPSTEPYGIVTGGEASASGTPDQLTFTASVSNTRATTALAMEATNHDVRAVTIAARQAGVDAKDIQTQSVSIRKKYDYRYRGPVGPRFLGYASSERIKILVRKLTKAGKTIGGVTTAAGNAVSINGISLSISNQSELIAKARTAAVKKSKAAAEALAKAAGRSVGELEYVEEVLPQRQYFNYGRFANLDMAYASPSAGIAESVPISPGKQKVSVTVKVRWSLNS